MRTADLVTTFFLLLVGVAVAVESWKLGTGWGTDGPESGFLPFWLGVLLSVISLVVLLSAALRSSDRRAFVTREKLRPVLTVAFPAAAMVALTHVVGLYVISALYLGVYMRWIGRHSWFLVAAVGLGVPLATFMIFEKWFLVPLPKGPLEAWLGY